MSSNLTDPITLIRFVNRRFGVQRPGYIFPKELKQLTLKTKSIYEPREDDDGLRLLVTRFYPRGVKKDRFDKWSRELSPSRELLRAYRSKEKGWEVFKSEFIAELKASPSSTATLRSLRKESKKSDITLLCYERSGIPCHRYILEELIGNSSRLSAVLTIGPGYAEAKRTKFA